MSALLSTVHLAPEPSSRSRQFRAFETVLPRGVPVLAYPRRCQPIAVTTAV